LTPREVFQDQEKNCQTRFWTRFQIWNWAQAWHIMFVPFEFFSVLREAWMEKKQKNKKKKEKLGWSLN
jgi:hypothetical protein